MLADPGTERSILASCQSPVASCQSEVCEFRWIGGEISTGGALNNTTLKSAFTDLGFLYVP